MLNKRSDQQKSVSRIKPSFDLVADQKLSEKAKHDDQIRPKKLGFGKFAGTQDSCRIEVPYDLARVRPSIILRDAAMPGTSNLVGTKNGEAHAA